LYIDFKKLSDYVCALSTLMRLEECLNAIQPACNKLNFTNFKLNVKTL